MTPRFSSTAGPELVHPSTETVASIRARPHQLVVLVGERIDGPPELVDRHLAIKPECLMHIAVTTLDIAAILLKRLKNILLLTPRIRDLGG